MNYLIHFGGGGSDGGGCIDLFIGADVYCGFLLYRYIGGVICGIDIGVFWWSFKQTSDARFFLGDGLGW